MDDKWKRDELIRCHNQMRSHLYRIIDGLSQNLLLKEISDEENYPHLLSIIWHIGGAETYWFHRAKHDIAPKFAIDTHEDILIKLKANTQGLIRVVQECSPEQLLITPPSESTDPSVAWCILRTYQHGLYHTAQIAKIRHMINAPPLDYSVDTWDSAVDAISETLSGLWNES